MAYQPVPPVGQTTKTGSEPVTIASDDDVQSKLGIVTETAPANDTASSGLNGRLQRIAQRISSLLALIPTALTGSGNFKAAIVETTITQPVSNTGTFATQDSEKIVDNAGFTDGTSKVLAAGYILDEVAGTALTENDAAAARIDSKRAQVLTLEDATTRGQRAAISAAGAVKVDNSAVTQPVSGTVTVQQGTGTSLHAVVDSGTISTVTNVVHVDDNAGSLTVDAPVATPLFARLSDGAAALAGQKTMASSLPVTIASDQSTVPVSLASVPSHAVTNAGTFAVQDSEKLVDNAGFTDGTTKVIPVGYIFDEVAGTALTENDIAAPRIDSKRANISVLEDATTRGQRAAISAAGALKVDGSAVTQPVSGTITVNALPTGSNVIGKVSIDQTTPGTTNLVQIRGDQTTNSTASWTSATAGGTALTITITNLNTVSFAAISTSTFTGGVLTFEVSPDNTNWIPIVCARVDTMGVESTYTIVASTARAWSTSVDGFNFFRVRLSTAITGTGTLSLFMSAQTLAIEPIVNAALIPNTTGGLSTFHLVSAASTNLTNIKASAGQVFGWYIYNSNAAARKVAFHNTAGAPTAGAGVVSSLVIPPSAGANVMSETGITFSTGIAISTVTGLADSDTAAVGANDLVINIFYK